MDSKLPVDLAAIVDAMVRRHRVHTVILYGSRARGEARETSDYDVAGIREGGGEERDARPVDGLALDGFVYGESKLATLEPGMTRMRDGRALLDPRGYGAELLARIEAMVLLGPTTPASEIQMEEVWMHKMLARIAEGGLVALHRRADLLTQLPEMYFKRHAMWFQGPRVAFPWLRDNDPRTYAALERALEPGADLDAIRALVERVLASPKI